MGRLTESNQRGWITQKSAQWEVVPTLDVKGWKQGRVFPEPESTRAAILEGPLLTHGCWEEARQTDPPSVRPPTLYSPPVPHLTTQSSAGRGGPQGERWPQQMGKKQDHWRDRLKKDSLTTETCLYGSPPELFSSLPTFLPNQSRNSILGKRFLTHARLLDKRFVPYCLSPIFCAIQEEALFVLEKPRIISSQHLTMTSFWVDSVKSVLLEFGELSQQSPEKGDWINSLLYL